MKTTLINILYLIYSFTYVSILGLTILSPFSYGMKDAPPSYTYILLYVLAVLGIATSKKAHMYFQDNIDL